jgi:hypothetical protein
VYLNIRQFLNQLIGEPSMNRFIKSLVLFVFIYLSLFLFAYSEDWDLIPCVDQHKSIVSLRAELRPGVYGYCSGVVIQKTTEKHPEYPGFVLGKVLTCDHLLLDQPNKTIFIKFWSGRQSKGKILKRDSESDFMLISAWVDENCEEIPVSEKVPEAKDLCVLIGMGGVFDNGQFQPPMPENLRIFSGEIVGPSQKLFLDTKVIEGDSGGPILLNGKVIGIISGGYRWFDYEENKVKKRYTWPTISGGTNKLIKFLE